MLIKNVSTRLWTIGGTKLIPGAEAVEVNCTEADIGDNPDLKIVKALAKPEVKADKDAK